MPELNEFAADFLQEVAARPRPERVPLAEAMFAAAEFHGPQRRKNGELYMVHPLEVATLLAHVGADLATVTAGLLHDVLEDTPVPGSEIEARFGAETRRLVEATSKNFVTDHEQLYRLCLADPRIADLKVADRVANLSPGLSRGRHLFKLEETENFHLARLATIEGVNQSLVRKLREAVAESWDHYRSRTD